MKYFTYTNLDGYKMLLCVVNVQIFQKFLPSYFYPRPKYHPTTITYYYHINTPPLVALESVVSIKKWQNNIKTLSNQYLVKLFELKGEVQDF